MLLMNEANHVYSSKQTGTLSALEGRMNENIKVTQQKGCNKKCFCIQQMTYDESKALF